jgi:twinkle protein
MDWHQVEQQLCERVEEVCRHLLPNGRRHGAEWCVGSAEGERGDSFRVNLAGKVGTWKDFAGDQKGGGNLMGLWCHVRQQPFNKSIVEAKEWLGIREDHRSVQRAVNRPVASVGSRQGPKQPGEWSDLKKVWPRCQPLTEGGPVHDYLVRQRRIDSQVLEAYEVREVIWWDGKWVMVFPYYAPHAREEQSEIEQAIAENGGSAARLPSWLKLEKLERVDGRKEEWVTPGAEKCLFGMQLAEHPIFKRADHLLIVEGEKDALSWASYGCGLWHIAGSGGMLPVSVPFGAKHRPAPFRNAQGFMEQRETPNREWLDRCWDWMQGFETIFIGMDMDTEGDKAAADIISEIGPRRCRLVKLPEKNLTGGNGGNRE